MDRLRLHVIACSSLRPELEMLAAQAKTAVTLRHLEMGLHQRSAETLRAVLQGAIDAETIDNRCDAVALGYGLCNQGIVGVQARRMPVVIPRAHDCIGMLLGGSRQYLAQLEAQPGTYFQSAGWLENAPAEGDVRQPDFTFGPNSNVTRERLAERYGDDNADYLLEQFDGFTRHYERLAYIATPAPASARWEDAAKETAAKRNLTFERLKGDLGWLRRLVNGEWNANEFLTLQPGERVVLTFDERLIGAVPA
ncbi:MAG TPA: DUF1638 domain-containing protein [Rhizomicrobium sp.]